MEPPLQLVLILVLLGISAFFSGSEVAFLSVGHTRLRQLSDEGKRLARLVLFLRRHRAWVLSTVLIAITASNYLAERTATEVAIHYMGPALGPIIAFTVVTGVILIFCEVTPIHYGFRNRDAHSLRAAVPIGLFALLLAPVVVVFTVISRGLLYLAGVKNSATLPVLTEDYLKAMIEQSERQGAVPATQRRMLYGVLEFGNQTVAEVMTPRPDIVAVAANQSIGEALHLGLENNYSRLPVYEGNIDNVIGILYLKDLLPYVPRGELNQPVRRVARHPLYVPESLPANLLLRQLQSNHQMMAVVKDQYGGTAGIVTVEDVLEEIVGEIQDEYDIEEQEIIRLTETQFLCEAAVSLHLLEHFVRQKLPSDEYDSLGGLLLELAGDIPQAGESFTYGSLELVVEQMDGPRLEKIRVVERKGGTDAPQ